MGRGAGENCGAVLFFPFPHLCEVCPCVRPSVTQKLNFSKMGLPGRVRTKYDQERETVPSEGQIIDKNVSRLYTADCILQFAFYLLTQSDLLRNNLSSRSEKV